MTNRNPVQTRIDQDTHEQLESLMEEEDHESMAETLRSIIRHALSEPSDEPGLKQQFLRDIAGISRTWIDDLPFEKSISDFLLENLEDFSRPDLREQILEELSQVFVAGQGSSLSTAYWFAERLRDSGVDARAGSSEEIFRELPKDQPEGEAMLFLVSRSGETASIVQVCERARQLNLSTVGFTSKNSDLARHATELLPLPTIPEETPGYNTRSVILQVAVLQVVFFGEQNPNEETIIERFDTLDSFIDGQLEFSSSENPAFALTEESQFTAAADALAREGDLALDPIASTLGIFQPQSHELAQKNIEFLHAHSSHPDLGSVRDTYVTILLSDAGYLFTILPYSDSESYEYCQEYMYGKWDSIEDLIRFSRNPVPLRFIVLSFNDVREDNPIESITAERSLYGNSGVISLQSHDQFIDELVMFIATFLFTYAVFEERVKRDLSLREAVDKGADSMER